MRETKIDLDQILPGGVTTNWTQVILPLSDFAQVDRSALDNLSITHLASGTVFLAEIGFLQDQRSHLGGTSFTEAERWTRQSGSSQRDMKAAASAGEVLGWGWGMDGGDYAEYEFYLARDLSTPTLHLQYACGEGNGRLLDVRWNGQLVGTVNGTNTGGWGETSNQFSLATLILPSATSTYHKLTFYANGLDVPVNLDCWWLTDGGSAYRECEDFDTQSGGDLDLKAGASGGATLGHSWGQTASSEALYSNVTAGAQTGAWFHLWFARYAPTGTVLDVALDGQHRARLYAPPTAGWGERAGHFDRASAFLGALEDRPYTVRLSVPEEAARAINLDCFYLGPQGPEGLALDSDGDGLGDREEETAGTSLSIADTDGDGLPDGLETQYGLGGQVSDPTRRDTDADGQDDRAESMAGTDPWNASDLFELTAITQPTADFLRIQWPAVSGRHYQLYFTAALSNNASFEPAGGSVVIENNVARYDESPTQHQRIYRIDVSK